MQMMILQVESARKVKDPAQGEIREAISALRLPSPCFAILSSSKLQFVQTAFSQEGGLILEYQDGSTSRHFQSIRGDFSVREVTDVFLEFSRGDTSWKSRVQWRPTQSDAPVGPLRRFSTICLVLYLIFIIPLFFGVDPDNRVKVVHLDAMSYLTLCSYLLLCSSLDSLARFRQLDGRGRAYAVTSIILAIVMTLARVVSWMKT
jgi:hypothetical protein